jgi:hypothetical protein
MTFKADLKAMGLGGLAFIGGYLVFMLVTAAVLSAGSPSSWLVLPITALGAALPGWLAGFTGAYFARSRFVFHGLAAGGTCSFLAFFSTVLASPSAGGIALLIALLAVWLGAIVGSYVRSRRGP